MKPNSLENLLKQEAPQPDPAARVAARRAALAEFARIHPQTANDAATRPRSRLQALLGLLRLSRESQSRGSDTMPWYSRRGLVGGAASIFVAVIGAAVVWDTVRQPAVTELNRPLAVPPPRETGPGPANSVPETVASE